MGRYLQIRVIAESYEGDVEKAWPKLWKLVWGEGGEAIPKKGVLELAQAVFDAARVELISPAAAEALKEKSEVAEELRFKVEKALNARDPQTADQLSYEIEDCLDVLEDIAKKF